MSTILSAKIYNFSIRRLLHFAWGVAEAKCIAVTAVYVSLCLSVCLSLAAFPHYCTDPHVSWGNGRGCTLVVQCWADLQSVHGFRCYDNIAPNAKCQRVLVLCLCLVLIFYQYCFISDFRLFLQSWENVENETRAAEIQNGTHSQLAFNYFCMYLCVE